MVRGETLESALPHTSLTVLEIDVKQLPNLLTRNHCQELRHPVIRASEDADSSRLEIIASRNANFRATPLVTRCMSLARAISQGTKAEW